MWQSGSVRVLDRSLSRLPRPWRTLVDWALTLTVAIAAILIFQAEVAKPYRIPTASMEPTLRVSDRVIANRVVYRLHAPERGDIVVFDAPAAVEQACSAAGGAFIKRIVGLPGEVVSMRDGRVYVDGAPLREPYLRAAYRGHESGRWPRVRGGQLLRARRQPDDVVRLAPLGCRTARTTSSAAPRPGIWPPDRIGDT